MNRWIKVAAFVAVAAIVAGLSGGAGATSSPAGGTKAGSMSAPRSTASILAARRASLLRHANLDTIAGVKRYLRAIGANARGVVIQRGARNYAGPSCPGAGWACTSTAHPVVQVAAAGGKNTFLCTTGNCVVVQSSTSRAARAGRSLTAAAAVTNTAKCIKTTGLTQSCSINQNSAGMDNNTAVVFENAGKRTGLMQTASYSASVTQTADAGMNRACVDQEISIDGSTNLSGKKTNINVALEAHQSVTITQNSNSGGNSAAESATSTDCTGQSLTQIQALSSSATGTGSIMQNENAGNNGANISLDIEQNQGAGFSGSASGENHAVFQQTSNLSAVASTPSGPVNQTQSSTSGGILAKVNQNSHNKSTADAKQTESQCAHAQVSGVASSNCTTGTPPGGSFVLVQKQVGPIGNGGGSRNVGGRRLAGVHKGVCPPDCSTQTGNSADTFTINQSSDQKNDTHTDQTNTVTGECTSDGFCSDTQTTSANGTTTSQQTVVGSSIDTSTDCTGGSCTTSTPSGFVSGDVLVSIGNGLVEERSPSGALVRTLDTGKGNGIFTTGLALDSNRNLYVTDFNANDVTKILSDGTVSSFGSGYGSDPESIVFDNAGNAYVGQADTPLGAGGGDVLKFSSTGAPLASYDAAVQTRGTDWIDLAPDQCTLYYTSEGTSVKRFNVCTSTQLADFATGLPGPGEAFAIKLLPGGGALVADDDSIVRLNNAGAVVQSYGSGESGSGGWFCVALDPDGTSFWAGDIFNGKVTRFNLTTGAVITSFTTGGTQPGGLAAGIVVVP